MPWVRNPNGGPNLWQDPVTGETSEDRPYTGYQDVQPREGASPFSTDVRRATQGTMNNLGIGIENVWNGETRLPDFGGYFRRPPPTPAQTAPSTPPALPGPIQYDPATFGVDTGSGPGGPPVTQITPEAFPTPPAREPNPGLQDLVQYMREREGRTSGMFERYLQSVQQGDPTLNPRWQRIAAILGQIAAQPRLAFAGRATSDYLADEQARRAGIQEQVMRIGLAREDLSGDTAEAMFNARTGEWEAEEGTERDVYNTNLSNIGARNEAARYNAARSDEAGAARYSSGQALARQEYLQASEELRQALGAAAAGGDIEAYGSLFGRLPEGMQQTQVDRAAQQGLASIIAENGNRSHRKMEELAGRELPRPPRQLRDNPTALARWYAQNGVPLTHPEVRSAFPGFATATE